MCTKQVSYKFTIEARNEPFPTIGSKFSKFKNIQSFGNIRLGWGEFGLRTVQKTRTFKNSPISKKEVCKIDQLNYSGDLNSEVVRYSNVPKTVR